MSPEASGRPFSESAVATLKAAGEAAVPGWGRATQELLDASEMVIRCEAANRKRLRAVAFGLTDIARGEAALERTSHSQSVAHMKSFRRELKGGYRRLPVKQRSSLDRFARDPKLMSTIASQGLEHFKRCLVDEDLPPDQAGHLPGILEEVFTRLERDGVSGLIENLDRKAEEVIRIRSDRQQDRGRGRVKSNPIPILVAIFKAFLIGLLFSVAIVSIIQACDGVERGLCIERLWVILGVAAVLAFALLQAGC